MSQPLKHVRHRQLLTLNFSVSLLGPMSSMVLGAKPGAERFFCAVELVSSKVLFSSQIWSKWMSSSKIHTKFVNVDEKTHLKMLLQL